MAHAWGTQAAWAKNIFLKITFSDLSELATKDHHVEEGTVEDIVVVIRPEGHERKVGTNVNEYVAI